MGIKILDRAKHVMLALSQVTVTREFTVMPNLIQEVTCYALKRCSVERSREQWRDPLFSMEVKRLPQVSVNTSDGVMLIGTWKLQTILIYVWRRRNGMAGKPYIGLSIALRRHSGDWLRMVRYAILMSLYEDTFRR